MISLEQIYNPTDPPSVRIGSFLMNRYGDIYLVARVGRNEVILISLLDGNRYSDSATDPRVAQGGPLDEETIRLLIGEELYTDWTLMTRAEVIAHLKSEERK